MANPLQAIPSTSLPFVTVPDGVIQQPWYRLLLNLWNRTGGNTGDTSGLPSTLATDTGTLITAINLNTAVLLRAGPTGNFVDTMDTAKNYIKAHNFPIAPSTNYSVFINTTSHSWAITPVNSVTFMGNLSSGNFIIPANTQRVMTFEINNITTPAITIYG